MTALEEVLSRLDLPEDTQDLLEQTDFDDAKSLAAVMPFATWQNVPAWSQKRLAYTLQQCHQQHQHLHKPCLGVSIATCQYLVT